MAADRETNWITYRAARNFFGSLFLRIDDFLCFVGTFAMWFFFSVLAIHFFDFQEVAFKRTCD